jgi:ADP-ribose pyrophosphatase
VGERRPERARSAEAGATQQPASFEVVGSELIARAGFLALTEERVRGPEGDEFTRVVVRHPGAVVVVPVVGDGALLVRQFRAAVGAELLEVPAGKRDVDGEPPEETARRELEEEIGRRPGRLVKLVEFFNTPGFSDEYTHLFAALDLEDLGTTRAVGPEEKAMTVEHVPFAAVDDLVAAGEIRDAKTIIGLLLARRSLDAAS